MASRCGPMHRRCWMNQVKLARQYGTRCQMNLEITTVFMALNDFWKHFFLAVTSVTSALEIFLRDVIYVLHKSTFYLLTYLHTYIFVCLIFVYVSKKERKGSIYNSVYKVLHVQRFRICKNTVERERKGKEKLIVGFSSHFTAKICSLHFKILSTSGGQSWPGALPLDPTGGSAPRPPL